MACTKGNARMVVIKPEDDVLVIVFYLVDEAGEATVEDWGSVRKVLLDPNVIVLPPYFCTSCEGTFDFWGDFMMHVEDEEDGESDQDNEPRMVWDLFGH